MLRSLIRRSAVRLAAASLGITGIICTAGCRSASAPVATTDWAETPADRASAPTSTAAVREADNEAPAKAKVTDGPPASAVILASALQVDDSAGGQRFEVPEEIPGAEADPLRLPPFDPTQSHEQRRSAIESLFPDVPTPMVAPGPYAAESTPLVTLGELQQIAVRNSPALRVAAADVREACGLAVQAGLYPNPTVGYEGDSLGTARTAGYNGLMVTQEFVTAGKLDLAQTAAMMKVRAAEQRLRKARIALASDVRRGYFAVLIAHERVKYARAIAHLADEVYAAQIDLVAAGEAAAYEPLQLRVFSARARNDIVQAENDLSAAWRGLAASLGLPQMAYRPPIGSAEMSPPSIDYDQASGILLSRHSDLAAAQALITSACYNVRLQEAMPIPNLTVYTAFQHDDTTTLNDFAANVQVGLPLPIFDRNQGNITAAHAQLGRAHQDLADTRNQLLGDLAQAYNRFATNRTIAENFRFQILPDQVRVYRGVYDRFRQAGGVVDFAQIVVSQQALADAVTSYVDALQAQWESAVDLAELMQVDDFFGIDNLAAGLGDAPPELPPESPPAE
ncbi:MAG: TolC family protein [Planctomycetaceae bacterium]|nr:TolC family protein [Planctomycetaceae bacterium]